jgi:hypothetical protein
VAKAPDGVIDPTALRLAWFFYGGPINAPSLVSCGAEWVALCGVVLRSVVHDTAMVKMGVEAATV